jgi:hypothetical protein
MGKHRTVDNERMTIRDERGGIFKVIIWLAILGVILFDLGSIVFNIFSLDSTADTIANEVSNVSRFDALKDPRALKEKAAELADAQNAKLVKFTIGTDGIIRLSLRRRAKTIVVGRIGPIEDWAKATGEGQATTE